MIDNSNNFIKDYIIYGAGDAGRQIYSSLENINKKVFCFIDDNKHKQSKDLYGKKIISYTRPPFFDYYFKHPSYSFTQTVTTPKLNHNFTHKLLIIPKQPCLNVCFCMFSCFAILLLYVYYCCYVLYFNCFVYYFLMLCSSVVVCLLLLFFCFICSVVF